MKEFLSALLFFILLLALPFSGYAGEPKLNPKEIKAIYLSTNNLFKKKKIAELEEIIRETTANGIVIDFKDSSVLPQEYMTALAKRFKDAGAYTIARIVTFQDSSFARKHPKIAVKDGKGNFWYSGLMKWKRYWLDPASELAQDYNIAVAKRAIDAGFDEMRIVLIT